jgi:hypothetical protein
MIYSDIETRIENLCHFTGKNEPEILQEIKKYHEETGQDLETCFHEVEEINYSKERVKR